MRKSSSPSLSNCNSILANKIFGIPLDELQPGGQPDNEVPFIVCHVVDYIEEHGSLEQQGLFQVNGNAETVEWLQQRYDSGEEVDLVKEADVPSAISLLRFFLQELPEPVIPGSWHILLIHLSQDYNNEDEFGRKLRFLLQQLPPVNYSLLKFLCRFLANVASHHEEIWSANSLAAVFGPDVFHIYTDVEDMKEQEIGSRIMAGLLENYYEFFENEEVNDLSEEEEDEKLERIEELPEEGAEKSNNMPEVVQLRMTENILESNSVIASTSAHMSPTSILPASAEVDAADGIINASDSSKECSEPVAGANFNNEVMQQDTVFEDEENQTMKVKQVRMNPEPFRRRKKPPKEATLEFILKKLKEKRVERCLPEDIKKMTKDHLVEEKTSLQKILLSYESQHGCLVTREERNIVKPRCDRYRLVKQMLTRASITPLLGSPSTKRGGQMLQPIIEGETAQFFEEIKEEEDGISLSSKLNILKTAIQAQSSLENSESDIKENQKLALDLRLSSTRAASMPELLEQLWKARAEKKKLRKTLCEFEEAFYQQNGRNTQKEDPVPVLEEYREYKKIQAKLRLLEVLISKQDSSKSI
ncbi:Protein FAM13B [Heterocephalus glaber]|uniref:Protein FAM13B n=1 Tax=Heterocephalus glaber TaxID=10181 RepID=G5ALF3_HETGA|nr:Protein FAM13B [Heterocephalus glaber]